MATTYLATLRVVSIVEVLVFTDEPVPADARELQQLIGRSGTDTLSTRRQALDVMTFERYRLPDESEAGR